MDNIKLKVTVATVAVGLLLGIGTEFACLPKTKYVGVVKSINWSGNANVLTKTKLTHQDTLVNVYRGKYEYFYVGQTLTFYTDKCGSDTNKY